ncbi:hypothetical protein CR513_07068, partial [Mucuna pruriens]
MAYNQANKERKLQLQELEELRLEAYENSRIYKKKVKQFHDNRILRKEFRVSQKVLLFNSRLKLIVVELRDEANNRNFKVNGHQIKLFYEEIQDVVDLQNYENLSELVRQAIKVDMKIRRSASRKAYVESIYWKDKETEKDRARREKSPKKGSESSIGRKEFTPTPVPMPPRASSIKCFKCLSKGHIASKCLNRRVMILKKDREIEINFTLGAYEDRVMCGVVLMEATHQPFHTHTFGAKGINRLLEEFQDVFPKDVPHELPPLRGIKHHMDLTLRATLPKRATYRTNLEEAKEIQK